MEPVLLELLDEKGWQKVEEGIGEAATILLQQQNEMGIAPAMDLKTRKAEDGRHHMEHDFWGIGGELAKHVGPPLKSLLDNQVLWMQDGSLILWNEEADKWPLLLQKTQTDG